MRDGRRDAREPVEVPVPPGNSYRLGPRWSVWMASLPLLGLVVAGAVVAARSSGTIEVIDAAALPEVPTLPIPTSATTTVPAPSMSPGSPGSPTVPDPAPVVALPATASTTTRGGRFDDLPPVAPPVLPSTTQVPAAGPRGADDCRDGGWQRWVDGDGQPFANQGRCIQFVESGGQHPG